MSKAHLVESVTSLPGYTHAVGTRVLRVETGVVEMALDRKAELLQFSGFFHGGVIAGLADHAAGAAVSTALPDGRIGVTIDLHVNFLSPASGESLVARARAIHVGNTICFATVDVLTVAKEKERTCAMAAVTLRAVDMPLAPAKATQ